MLLFFYEKDMATYFSFLLNNMPQNMYRNSFLFLGKIYQICWLVFIEGKTIFSLKWEIIFSFHLWYNRRGFGERPPPPHFEIQSWTLLSPHTALPFGKTYWIRAWFHFFSWRVVWTEAHLLYMFLLFLLFPTFCCYLASHVFKDLIVCNCWTHTSLFRIPWVFKMVKHLPN